MNITVRNQSPAENQPWVLFQYAIFKLQIFAYLLPEDIKAASKALDRSEASKTSSNAVLLLRQMANRSDLGLLHPVFEQPSYLHLQEQRCINLNPASTLQLSILYQTVGLILSTFNQECQLVTSVDCADNIVSSLFFDPCLPLPHLKSDKYARFCATPLQEYVALKSANASALEQDEPEQDLQPLLEVVLDKSFVESQAQLLASLSFQQRQKIERVRHCPQSISISTFQELLISGLPLHNLVVCLLSLSSAMANWSRVLVKDHQDGLSGLLELNLRFNIYRNMILGVETNFKVLFESYEAIAPNAQGSAHEQPLQFWHAALAQWKNCFDGVENMFSSTMDYILAQQRQHNLEEILNQKMPGSQSFSTPLKNAISIQLSVWIIEEYRVAPAAQADLGDLVFGDLEVLDFLSRDYLDYMLDLAITPLNVHYCGHSKHDAAKSQALSSCAGTLATSTINFYNYIKHFILEKCPPGDYGATLAALVSIDYEFLQSKLAKPFLLAQIYRETSLWLDEVLEQQFGLSAVLRQKLRPSLSFDTNDALIENLARKITNLPHVHPLRSDATRQRIQPKFNAPPQLHLIKYLIQIPLKSSKAPCFPNIILMADSPNLPHPDRFLKLYGKCTVAQMITRVCDTKVSTLTQKRDNDLLKSLSDNLLAHSGQPIVVPVPKVSLRAYNTLTRAALQAFQKDTVNRLEVQNNSTLL